MKKFLAFLLAAVMATALLAGCGAQKGGTVATDGSTSMEKVIGALGESFMQNNTGIDLHLQPHRLRLRHHRPSPRAAATSVFPAAA